jgi:hypothetical protein
MPRYYFNLEDGHRVLDDRGLDLRDLEAAQNEALRTSTDILKAGPNATLWNGAPWRLWVTDKPNGEGKTFFTLSFSAEM